MGSHAPRLALAQPHHLARLLQPLAALCTQALVFGLGFRWQLTLRVVWCRSARCVFRRGHRTAPTRAGGWVAGRTLDASRPCALGVFLAGLVDGDAAGSASAASGAGFSTALAVRLRRNGVFLAVVGVLVCGESGGVRETADLTRSSCGVFASGSSIEEGASDKGGRGLAAAKSREVLVVRTTPFSALARPSA